MDDTTGTNCDEGIRYRVPKSAASAHAYRASADGGGHRPAPAGLIESECASESHRPAAVQGKIKHTQWICDASIHSAYAKSFRRTLLIERSLAYLLCDWWI